METKPFFYTYSRPTLYSDIMVFDDYFANLGLYTSSLVQFKSIEDFEKAISIMNVEFFFDVSPFTKEFKDSYNIDYYIGDQILVEPFAFIDDIFILSKSDELTQVLIMPLEILNTTSDESKIQAEISFDMSVNHAHFKDDKIALRADLG